MATWDPNLYLRFANERLRPALDLIRSVSIDDPALVYDLGCGTGTLTAMLKERWPRSQVAGIDASPEMLERARELNNEITWIESDLKKWKPNTPSDLVFSNAVLHWMDDHEVLFPHLVEGLISGGLLAVQMPSNFGAPTHTSIAETVRSGPWRASLEPILREHPVHDVATYYRILSPHTSMLDIWETTYYHILDGDNPVVEWTKGSILRPLLAQLGTRDAQRFLEVYGARIQDAYPKGFDGKTVLPFKRIFMIARR